MLTVGEALRKAGHSDATKRYSQAHLFRDIRARTREKRKGDPQAEINSTNPLMIMPNDYPSVPDGFEEITEGTIPKSLVQKDKVIVFHNRQRSNIGYKNENAPQVRKIGGWCVMKIAPNENVQEYLRRNASYNLRVAVRKKHVESERIVSG